MQESVSVLISEAAINLRLAELAGQLNRDYAGETVTMVCALKGAFIFMADLARRMELNVRFDFLKVSSYGTESMSSGRVTLGLEPEPLAGRHVLLVEDIVDTGHTLVYLRQYFTGQDPASFRICALLDKPDRRVAREARFDYLGFTIPDVFVVGYGLDYAQRYRNLPYVGALTLPE